MNELTRKLNAQMHPFAGLIVYTGNDDFYIESHLIQNGKLGAGQPLTESFLRSITEKMKVNIGNKKAYSGGIMPSNILYLDQRSDDIEMIWYEKPSKWPVFFSTELGIPNGSMFVPGLMFHCRHKELKVLSYKGDAPTPETKLCEAPFFNVGKSGDVCLGNAVVPYPDEPTFNAVMKYWQKMFFGSEFTHLTGNENPTKSNLVIITKSLINTQKPFPENELKETKTTIEKYIKHIK